MRILQSTGKTIERGEALEIEINGRTAIAYDGETIATVLFAEGVCAFRHTHQEGKSRALFCGIGVCYDCLVTVDGVSNMRACMTRVKPYMCIQTQVGLGNLEEV
jgi:aerobic-type carbon monoxide dehydrogenase small subunit (CoxS/CutS family)